MLIVGGGLAGDSAASELRAQGWTGKITLVGDEQWRPYDRPPLSKGVLQGNEDAEHCYLRPQSWYDEQAIEMIAGDRAVALDTKTRRVALASGRSCTYTKLLLATGSRAKQLPLLDRSPLPIRYLRSLDDAFAIRTQIKAQARIAIIGGGVIGLEAAASAAHAGCRVTVIEGQDRVMARCVSPGVSQFLQSYHEERGVEINCAAALEEQQDNADALLLANGERIVADLVLVGIGATPNCELAEQAGLEVDDGIIVDASTHTSNPHIHAAGDVARFENGESLTRAEHWQHAVEQAVIAAQVMLGKPSTYAPVPWFWSDQFDLNIQVTGRVDGDSDVLRGSFDDASFVQFHIAEGAVVGATTVNQGKWKRAIRTLIESGAQPPVENLADPAVNLKKLAARLVPAG